MALPIPWEAQFVLAVVEATGLDPWVVYGWMLAEGGPQTNPLNIGPGRRYADVDAAAKATIELLRHDRYSPILAAARGGDPLAQIAAIVNSPWDAGNYRGRDGAKPGTLLRGTYERAKSEGIPGLSESGGLLDGVRDALDPRDEIEAGVGAIGAAIGGVSEFAYEKAALGLAYVVLTGAAAALFVIGLNRVGGSVGLSPLSVAMLRGGGKDEIPF